MALAQSGIGTGTIDGTVVDADRAAVPGVTIEVRELATGLSRQAVTDARGRFSLIALSPGVYALEGTLAGFAPVHQRTASIIPRTAAFATGLSWIQAANSSPWAM